ncbi:MULTISPECIES: hypothetical protein [Miniimonas]|uniref:hypothetical protein n=1 Tax=Miniimonas TaxID=947525 RepID=UPI001F20E6A9|nr:MULTISPECIES: hypothetical protein [Miniimonas]
MRRAVAGVLGVAEPSTGEPADLTPASDRSPERTPALRTEFAFALPRGYLDDDGVLHRVGTMRLATARDELLPLYDARVQENPAFTTVVLLSRVITELGTLPSVTSQVVESMFASDVAFLQDLYRRINAEGHTHAAVVCPSCQQHFTVDISGGRLGES